MNGRFISYLRVSTDKQGKSGLGIEAQRAAVAAYLNGGNWTLCKEYTEIESGTRNSRPELKKALNHCKLVGATLVIAKVDRLARNALFLLTILEGCGEDGVVFCDMPHISKGPAGKLQVGMMAQYAEFEAGIISQRTKDALAACKARGVKLGGFRANSHVDPAAGLKARQDRADAFAGRVKPLVADMQAKGMSLRQIAASLTEQGIRTPRDGAWTAASVRNVLLRVAS